MGFCGFHGGFCVFGFRFLSVFSVMVVVVAMPFVVVGCGSDLVFVLFFI